MLLIEVAFFNNIKFPLYLDENVLVILGQTFALGTLRRDQSKAAHRRGDKRSHCLTYIQNLIETQDLK